jgi:hypothetical protein
VDIAVSNSFSISLLLLAKILDQIEATRTAFSATSEEPPGIQKSRQRLHRRRRVNNARFQEAVSHVANELLHAFRRKLPAGLPGESVLVSNITSHDAHFVRFWVSVEPSRFFLTRQNFFLRK